MSKFQKNGYYYIKLVEDAHVESSKNTRDHYTIRAGDTVIAGLKKSSNGITANIANPNDPCSPFVTRKYNFSGCYPEFSIVAAIPAVPVRKIKEQAA